MGVIEFWYEFGSTYSYPVAMRIEPLAAEAGVSLRWRPFLLGTIFRTLGWNESPFNIFPAKGRYMWRDLERVCAAGGLPLKLPPVKFPQNGLKAARLALVGEEGGWTPAFTRAVFAANYAEQKDISEDVILGAILTGLGIDAMAAFAAANVPQNKDALRGRLRRPLHAACSARRPVLLVMNCSGVMTAWKPRLPRRSVPKWEVPAARWRAA
jgi:2-hydroxychromene-2-carboxylate isomerase